MKMALLFAVLFSAVCLFAVNGKKTPSVEKILQEKGITITYPGWKLKALSFSYDDGNIADRRLVSIFNKYGMKGSFHIPSAWLTKKPKNRVTEKEILSLYAGHEISGHGANHLSMGKIPLEKLEKELDDEIKEWQKITGKKITGYAYPFGSYSKTVIAEMRKRGLIYARTVGRRGAVFSLPGDFMKWSAQGHHGNNIDMLADKYLAYKPQKMSVLLVWGHSYEFPKADNWNVIEKFCEKMSRKKDIYYATMGEIALYVTAGRNLKISSDGKKLENPTKEKIFFVRNGKNLVLEAGKSYSF
ncbi:MAG: polysaccharide deacetylase family protein [Lentisphaeria bacterium]|nr:polysaccharide deacetylase family protein [Lentisphaeria bacterium]